MATNDANPVKSVIDGDEFVDKDKEKASTISPRTRRPGSYVGLPFGNPQVAFQQKFDVWNTLFYNGIGPEDYTILPDQ